MSYVVRFPRTKVGDPIGLLEHLISEVQLGETDSVFVISMKGNEWTFNLEGECGVAALIGRLEFAKQELLRRMN